jgi:large subunit ribosomal protein L9
MVAKNIKRLRSRRLPKGARGGIELLLIQTVENLGKPGDVVEVKPGYANNYLIPQGLATVATDHHKRMVEKHRAKIAEIERARMASLKALAEELSRQSVTIEANANDEGHLYGSVGANEIAAALKQQNFNIAPDQVRLEGVYTVRLHVGPEIDAELKVWVVPTAAEPQAEKR